AGLLTAAIGKLEDRHKPARFPSLASKLAARMSAGGIDFTLDAADDKQRIKLAASGRHDLGSARGTARLSGSVQPFAPQRLQPGDLSPALAQDLPPIEGRLGLGGRIDWSGTRLMPHLLLTLADLAGSFGGIKLSGGHGVAELDSLSPPATPAGQLFAANL